MNKEVPLRTVLPMGLLNSLACFLARHCNLWRQGQDLDCKGLDNSKQLKSVYLKTTGTFWEDGVGARLLFFSH